MIRNPLKDPVRLIKGSHIVVRRRFEHDCGYILQAADNRVVFVLRFAQEFTLIGTTDENFVGDVNSPAPDAAEILYLCATVNEYFRDKVTPDELVWSFAGVRALHDDGSGKPEDVTRDYTLVLDEKPHEAPLLTVYGGKITTHRRLAEDALEKTAHFFQLHRRWTASTPLPGGDFLWDAINTRVSQTLRAYPFLTEPEAWRLVRAYGTRVDRVLGQAKTREDVAPFFGPLSAAEVRYLMKEEWARTADDILWRRSKLGLKLTPGEKELLARFMVQSTG
jgi:glycerol-3-phosphate dehydrogenase